MAKLGGLLTPSQVGLAVEGIDDKQAIEAYLTVGEGQHWGQQWRQRLRIEAMGSVRRVFDEVTGADERVWGLIDRDWRSEAEIAHLQLDYPRLLVLPRITIENYCIDPDEMISYLPPHALEKHALIRAGIESHVDDWLQNGALWRTLHEHGAFQFCRGHLEGYPMALLYHPVTDEHAIARQFERWHHQLDLDIIMTAYHETIAAFRADPSATYRQHLHGKNFFAQVVVQQVLNPLLGQQAEGVWFDDFFNWFSNQPDSTCPPDIIPLLQRLVT